MELGIANRIVDLKIYEVSTGNLVLTQSCPTSLIGKIVSSWTFQQPIRGTYKAVVNSKLTSADMNSNDLKDIQQITDYAPEIT